MTDLQAPSMKLAGVAAEDCKGVSPISRPKVRVPIAPIQMLRTVKVRRDLHEKLHQRVVRALQHFHGETLRPDCVVYPIKALPGVEGRPGRGGEDGRSRRYRGGVHEHLEDLFQARPRSLIAQERAKQRYAQSASDTAVADEDVLHRIVIENPDVGIVQGRALS
eukprot:scaffold1355_cov268-Pinguiococcus_pyrenoidosus.AAC.85